MTQFEVIHNIQTGETVEKEYTKEQIADSKALQLEAEKRAENIAEVEAARASALAKLAALGLTADEIAAL